MDIGNLVGMANRIGDFFESMPDAAEAKQGIAQHIRKFWEPRMRRELLARLGDADAPALHALVREALLENLDMLTPSKPEAT